MPSQNMYTEIFFGQYFNIGTVDKWYLHLLATVIDTFEVTILGELQSKQARSDS